MAMRGQDAIQSLMQRIISFLVHRNLLFYCGGNLIQLLWLQSCCALVELWVELLLGCFGGSLFSIRRRRSLSCSQLHRLYLWGGEWVSVRVSYVARGCEQGDPNFIQPEGYIPTPLPVWWLPTCFYPFCAPLFPRVLYYKCGVLFAGGGWEKLLNLFIAAVFFDENLNTKRTGGTRQGCPVLMLLVSTEKGKALRNDTLLDQNQGT